MKKLLVVLLTLALCVTTLASCDFIGSIKDLIGGQEEVAYNVDAAADYVYNLYKNKSVTGADFEVTAVATIAGVKHTVDENVCLFIVILLGKLDSLVDRNLNGNILHHAKLVGGKPEQSS